MTKRNKIFIVIGLVLGLFILLNFNYLWANCVFLFRGNKVVYNQGNGNNIKSGLSEPNRLAIASLGVNAPIVYIQEKNEKAYQGALMEGVVHFPDTALPGQVGNCYIFGHSSDYIWGKGKYKSIFATLPSIKKGEFIEITDQTGNAFVYEVFDSFVVAANDVSVLNQETGGKKLLTLQTSYPIGTALKRFIVQAELK